MEKHFFVIRDDNENKAIIFHAPTSSVMLVGKDEIGDNLSDEYLYSRIPRLLKKSTEFEKVPVVGEGKVSLTFMSTRSCNLKCRYCFAGEGEYGSREDKPKKMSCDMYIKTIENIVKLYPEGIKSISLFGGEPLLNLPEIIDFIPRSKMFFEEKGLDQPYIGLSTNGTIMNSDIAKFIAKNNIAVVISLDGPKLINDSARKNKNDSYSVYDKVYECLEILKAHNINYYLEMTITKKHLERYKLGEMRRWLDELSSLGYINMVIVPVETDNPDLAIKTEEDYYKLDLLAREATNYYIDELFKKEPTGISTTFTNTLLQLAKKSVYRGCTAGKHLFIDTDGKIYPCHMFCNDDDFLLGSIQDSIYDTAKMQESVNVNRFGNEECSKCISQKVCGYWCKGIQYLSNDDMYKTIKTRCIFQNAIMEEGIKAYSKLGRNEERYRIFLRNISRINDKVKKHMELPR